MDKLLETLYRWIKSKNGFILTAFGVLLIAHFVLLKRLGISNELAVFDSLSSNLGLLVFAFILQNIQNFYHAKHPINIVNIGVIKVFSLGLTFYIAWVGFHFFPQEVFYQGFWKAQYLIRGIVYFLLLFVILYQFWLTKNEVLNAEKTEKLLEFERQLKQAELTNIHQQLKPHFLFNSLNSISALTMIEPKEAQRMVHLLSDFLRDTLQHENESFNSFSSEIKQVERYLEIEKIRFGNRLSIHLEIAEKSKQIPIPKLILQPLVENAIKHGLYGQIETFEIQIEAELLTHFLQIRISNPYDSSAVSAQKGKGFGLTSIQRKLEILYKHPHLLSVQKDEKNFILTLKIPIPA